MGKCNVLVFSFPFLFCLSFFLCNVLSRTRQPRAQSADFGRNISLKSDWMTRPPESLIGGCWCGTCTSRLQICDRCWETVSLRNDWGGVCAPGQDILSSSSSACQSATSPPPSSSWLSSSLESGPCNPARTSKNTWRRLVTKPIHTCVSLRLVLLDEILPILTQIRMKQVVVQVHPP